MPKLTAQGWHEHKLPEDLAMEPKEADLLRDAAHIAATGRYLGDGGICTEPARSIIKALVSLVRRHQDSFQTIRILCDGLGHASEAEAHTAGRIDSECAAAIKNMEAIHAAK